MGPGQRAALSLVGLALGSACSSGSPGAAATLLNVSYDPTRALYEELNRAFARDWEARTGQKVILRQSHGGSGKQARAVLEGLDADVVTLALAYDVDALHRLGDLLPADWRQRLPNGSVPFASTVVFVVRQGNPKAIRGWDDLVRPGVSVILANPKTSGGARWSYLAAWAHALRTSGGDEDRAREFVAELFARAPILDSGSRAATTSFAERELGDVLIAWESEAHLLLEKAGPDRFQIVVPPDSILAAPPVALVDRNVDRRGTRALAQAYLEFLYTPQAQAIGARHHYRPTQPVAGAGAKFVAVETVTVEETFGGWARAHEAHFAEGALFDRLYGQGPLAGPAGAPRRGSACGDAAAQLRRSPCASTTTSSEPSAARR